MRRSRQVALGAGLIALAALAAPVRPASADAQPHGKIIAGYVEKLVLEPWGVTAMAKLDTGAQTSSVHARDIERFTRDGSRWVRFTMILDTSDGLRRIPAERPVVRRVRIKTAKDGEYDHRYSVHLDLCFDGRRQRAEFTLADRDDMLYPVLLGRRFLENVAVVDPSETFLVRSGCATAVDSEDRVISEDSENSPPAGDEAPPGGGKDQP
jgi:hypothetical protein